MNRSGGKVAKAQLKKNEQCLNDYQKSRLLVTVEECTNADRKGKVAKAREKTVADDQKLCVSLDPLPHFAYTDAATVNDAAVAGPIGLMRALFGDPINDLVLLTSVASRETASCQKELLKRANKLEETVLKELNKAKKKAIKELTIDRAAALEAALGLALTSNKKITSRQEQLMKRVDGKCSSLLALPGAIFPGVCAAATMAEVQDCAIAAARCVACLQMNAFDALSLDCDQLDDQALNLSCPPVAP
jgi:hypothetical protein